MCKKNLSKILLLSLLLIMCYQGVRAYLTPLNQQHVIIYTTQLCPYCHTLRNLLNDYQINYQAIDVERTLRGKLAYLILGQPGVPISIINEQIIYGYDGELLTSALADAGYTIVTHWE